MTGTKDPFEKHGIEHLSPSSMRLFRENLAVWTGKYLLRHAFRKLLPPEIWNRRKMGFGVPLDHWFRSELRDLTRDTLLASDARCQRFFRRDTIEQLLREHDERRFDHAPRLWSLTFLELWLRQWT